MGAMIEIAIYLLQTLFSLLLLALLLRFLMQVVRADFYNPISQFLVKFTNPMITPLRRIIPGFGGVDVATLLLLLVIQMLGISLISLLLGWGFPNPLSLLIWSVLGITGLLVNFYFFALPAMIVLSFIAPGSRHPAILLLLQLTEPVMKPFRQLLPPMGGLDFSPILLFILINIARIILSNVAAAVQLNPLLVIGL